MMRSLPLLALLFVLAGCAAGSGGRLSYANVQSLNPGVTAQWVLREFPQGQVRRGLDGRVQTIRYRVTDPRGSPQTLELGFDANEVLREKRYSGSVVRPGGPYAQPPP